MTIHMMLGCMDNEPLFQQTLINQSVSETFGHDARLRGCKYDRSLV